MQDGSETYLKLYAIVFKTAICNCRVILNVKNLNYGQSVKDYHHDRQNKLKTFSLNINDPFTPLFFKIAFCTCREIINVNVY